MDLETHENRLVDGGQNQVKQGSGDSSNSGNGIVSENQVVLNSGETIASGKSQGVDAKANGLESIKIVADQEASGGRGIDKPLDEAIGGNSSILVNEVTPERTMVINSGEILSNNAENKDLSIKVDEFGLSCTVIAQEACIRRENGETLSEVRQQNHQDVTVLETVILVNSEENIPISGGNGQLEIKGSDLGQSKITADKSKTKVSKGEKQSCVIDMKCAGGGGGSVLDWDRETVCRICHLNSEGLLVTDAPDSRTDLIQLGCGCKDELGIVHAYCAEAWFKLKGNRICEICGEAAKNITGVGDNRFVEEWNQRRFIGTNSSSSDRGGSCWRGQPFCNFLMACLVIAFVLPWFFRVNMF
ncbi:hypothetical protein JCGZ_21589 [Jatropha curcas]|uniref:RING-CH-type domain-containing protein n=1 Tax=Jatropha curcas TaxID=180498 RepID=A0A067JEC4_JATCU|nr:uncharacterized protein LOC105649689 [Jatropha curcas]KDP21118.1 hypothetical protein JCGZ_21589 [Jatropha curcas]